MSQSVITTAFEQLKAEQAANGGVLTLDEFVFANVPDLNITDPIDRAESWPAPEQIVHRQGVSKTGTVNGNAVVYSVVLGAETGDFDFNWIGLINKASNTVAMIVHAPVQKKIKTASGQQGNVLTRSFMMEYNGASQITQITTPADTWQIDFTARLAGMDERIRKENIDTYGAASFYHDGFLVSQDDAGYSVKKGVGYVAGLRAELLLDKNITVEKLPVKIWVDVCWKGLLTSVWSVETKVTVAETLNNYSDNGQQHYVFAIAEIQEDGSVLDLRGMTIKQNKEITQDLQDKQPLNVTLTSLSDLEPEENRIPYFGTDAALMLATVTNLSLKILGRESVKDILSDLGLLTVPHSKGMRYLEPGVYTFIVPDGVYRIKARVIGGGGGAGGSQSAKSGGGGGGGGYAEGWFSVTPGQVITITVGAGGAGGTAGNFGVSGGLSSFGSFISAAGGAYGDAGGGGTGAGGFGGSGAGGDINSVGSDGSDGTTNGAAGGGTGGGSLLGGATRSGGTGRNSLSIGGGGAASYLLSAQSGGNGHAGAVILEY